MDCRQNRAIVKRVIKNKENQWILNKCRNPSYNVLSVRQQPLVYFDMTSASACDSDRTPCRPSTSVAFNIFQIVSASLLLYLMKDIYKYQTWNSASMKRIQQTLHNKEIAA